MRAVPGYFVFESLPGSPLCEAYRARGTGPAGRVTNVVVHILDASQATAGERTRLFLECERFLGIDDERLLTLEAVVRLPDAAALVFEDFKGVSLQAQCGGEALGLDTFFTIAPQLAAALKALHGAGLMHGCPRPHAVLFDPMSGRIKLGELGGALFAAEAARDLYDERVLHGLLPYLAPEYTGRQGRPVDARADLYGLGVIFYQMLTGRCPFEGDDPLALVHGHLARRPTPVCMLNARIPAELGALVGALLSKDPEDRPPGMTAVMVALSACAQRHAEPEAAVGISLSDLDGPTHFYPSLRLFGRAEVVERLHDAFTECLKGPAPFVLVSGESGVGKTALLMTLHEPVAAARGYFVMGRYDLRRCEVPYHGILAALHDLVVQRLGEGVARRAAWCEGLLEALGANAQAVVAVLPVLSEVVGSCAPLAIVGPAAAQRRFQLVFLRFLKAIASASHPVVIFLDNLQWIDPASVALLTGAQGGERIPHLLLVGAFRDGATVQQAPLMAALKVTEGDGVPIERLMLAPLSRSTVQEVVADSLGGGVAEAEALSARIYDDVGGNSFLVTQYLQGLYDQGLLTFIDGRWRVDETGLADFELGDDLTALMSERLARVGDDVRALLAVAACIGDPFDLDLLAAVHGDTSNEAWAKLSRALDVGLVRTTEVGYRFTHDRGRAVAMDAISESRGAEIHRAIGARLKEALTASASTRQVIEVVEQLNLGLDEHMGPDDRIALVELNLRAARRARAASAFMTAADLFEAGLSALTDGCWAAHHALSFALYVEAAEVACLNGEYDRMRALLSVAEERANGVIARACLDEIRMTACMAQDDSVGVLMLARRALIDLDVRLPRRLSKAAVLMGFASTGLALKGRREERLIKQRAMTDPAQRMAMRIMCNTVSAAYIAEPELVPLLTFNMVRLSLRSGNAPETAFAFASYAMVLAGGLDQVGAATRYGRLALSYLDADIGGPQGLQHARVIFLYEVFVRHRTAHLRETRQPLNDAFKSGLESGEFEFAGWACQLHGVHSVFLGVPLSEVERGMAHFAERLLQIGQGTVLTMQRMFQQLVENLRVTRPAPWRLTGTFLDEGEVLIGRQDIGDPAAQFALLALKVMLCSIFGFYVEGLESAEGARERVRAGAGMVLVPIFYFHDALISLGRALEVPAERTLHLKRAAQSQGVVARVAKQAPMNHRHRWLLIEAERLSVGEEDGAERRYKEAISTAGAEGYVNDEALALERLACHYQRAGAVAAWEDSLRQAHAAYRRWGALGKVAQLEQANPSVFVPASEAGAARRLTLSGAVDQAALVQGLQLISGEIEVDELLRTLVRLLLEGAGARRALLVLESGGALRVEAEGRAVDDDAGIEIQVGSAMEGGATFPEQVILSVFQSCEQIVFADTSCAEAVALDPYLGTQPRGSLLCLPIVRKGHRMGVLLLENDLLTGAFSADRVEVLKILAAQAAISLENARLYAELKASERAHRLSETRYRDLVHTAPDAIFTVGTDGRVTHVNRAFSALTGLDHSAALGLGFAEFFHPDDRAAAVEIFMGLVDGQEVLKVEARVQRAGGGYGETELTSSSIWSDGEVVGALTIGRDITARKLAERERAQLQAQFLQSQKLEAVGHLAGGIAHDFNNLLTVINGEADFALDGLAPDAPLRMELLAIAEAGRRAAELTRQLLAFSRKQPVVRRAVDLNTLLGNVDRMLRRLVGVDIEMRRETRAGLPMVLADAGQVEQVIVNLVVNAQDAIRSHDRTSRLIEIDLQFRRVDALEDVRLAPVEVGDFVCLSVTDSGVGIGEAGLGRIFEPFFTTKPSGKGTGLGLATVFRIVQQHGGGLDVRSEVGRGTRFETLWPCIEEAEGVAQEAAEAANLAPIPRGQEHILLVEDSQGVRGYAQKLLRNFGYTVYTANNGREALDFVEAKPGLQIDLLLTDAVMPEMGGDVLIEHMLARMPGLKVLMMSGHIASPELTTRIDAGALPFLHKPFVPRTLGLKVREVLDADDSPPHSSTTS